MNIIEKKTNKENTFLNFEDILKAFKVTESKYQITTNQNEKFYSKFIQKIYNWQMFLCSLHSFREKSSDLLKRKGERTYLFHCGYWIDLTETEKA